MKKQVVFLTNTIYGDSNYEVNLWHGVAAGADKSNVSLFTLAGGQLTPDGEGNPSVPFLFQLARNLKTDAVLINAGTIQAGLKNGLLERYIQEFPATNKATTALTVPSVNSVVVDNYSGMHSLVEHIVTGLGRQRVAYISGPWTNAEALERLRAYRDVLKAHGIPHDEALIFEGTWMGPSAVEGIRKFLETRVSFDALVCANDLMAVAALEELGKRGIEVPREVVVSGFDDSEESRFCIPQLSTVFQPIGTLGATAVELLARRIRGEPVGKLGLVPAQVVLRASAPAHLSVEVTEEAGTAARIPGTTPSDDPWLTAVKGLRSAQSPASWDGEVLDLLLEAWGQKSFPLASRMHGLLKKASSADRQGFLRLLTRLRADTEPARTTTEQWQRASSLERQLLESHRDFEIQQDFFQGKRTEAQMNALIAANRFLNGVSSVSVLEDALVHSFVRCGMQTCHVVLVERNPEGTARGKRIASMVGGRAGGNASQAGWFDLVHLIDAGAPGGSDGNWVVYPLVFEDQNMGYIVFQVSEALPFLYESLTNLVAGVLHSLLLIERIGKAEDLAARRADRIGELVRPMIRSLNETGALARNQGEVMAMLTKTNAETARRLAGMDRPVAAMKKALDQVMGLTSIIEEVSATINVIAINAAIAAARAGADGKVFSVISSEIRNLSVQTSTNTGQISVVLKELDEHSQSFVEANTQTKEVFARLESDVVNLHSSLESIQKAMENLNVQAELVLNTMANDA